MTDEVFVGDFVRVAGIGWSIEGVVTLVDEDVGRLRVRVDPETEYEMDADEVEVLT